MKIRSKNKKQAAVQIAVFNRYKALCFWMWAGGGDPALFRGQLVKSSLGFFSFTCHGISGNEFLLTKKSI